MHAHLSAARRAALITAAGGAAALILAGCGSSGTASPSGSQSGGSAPAGGSSAPSGGSGGSDLFPITTGATWIYSDTVASAEHGTVTDKVISAVPAPGGRKVTFSHVAVLTGLPKTTVQQTYFFHDDGSITVPFTQVGSTAITVKSGSILWPSAAVIASHRPHTSQLVLSIKGAGATRTVKAYVTVQGLGTQKVTVPAGSYDATVINEVISETVGAVHVNLTLRTWLAPGVGPVKEQASTSAAATKGLLAVQVLKSYSA